MLVTGAQPIEAISLEDMGYSFGPKVKPMFVGLNYEFKKGTSYWIKGGSGSGKSSLLKVISVLATPLGGDVLINGQSTRAMTFEEFLPYRLQIGYSFELGGLLSNKWLVGILSMRDIVRARLKTVEVENRYLRDYIEGKYPG